MIRILHKPAGLTVLLTGGFCWVGASAAPVEFNRDIRPILADKCYACHGPDAKALKGDLRLDQAQSAAKVGAIVPGKPDESKLVKRIYTTDADDLMPPPESHKKLTAAQKEMLKRWIAEGAEYQRHWAFMTPQRPETPRITAVGAGGLAGPIDAFIVAKLKGTPLKPAPRADKETLIRRVTLDLTGLPPTIAEVDAFLADDSKTAYVQLVDRLLKSPRFGEHQAHYWLDAARYGDTHGLHLDNERSMWPYRDWVVRAFNANLPFDQFTIWQLAGDLLPNPTQDQLIATGFNRCNVTTSEGGSINEEFLFRYAVDRTDTTAAVWMGLTAGCAVCHDHKFDPLTMKDFYSMYAFFYSSADPAMDGNKLLTDPILKLTTDEQKKQLAEFDAKIGKFEKSIREELAKVEYTDPATLDPPPPVRTVETLWVEDNFPAGVKPESNGGTPPLKWVTAKDGQVFSGKRAIRRTAKGVGQDFFSGLKEPFTLPVGGRVFLHVYLEPTNAPRAVMLQFNTGNWSHRAVWGELDAIDYGKKDSNERRRLGDLPKTGEWVKLEFDPAKLGLKPGAKIKGIAFTQADGTVFWDKAGVAGEVNPARDPSESLIVWLKQNQGKNVASAPDDVRRLLRSVKPEDRKPGEVKRLREYYFEHICNATRPIFGPLHAELDPIRKKRTDFDNGIPATFIWKDLATPREAFVMQRGQYTKPGERVYPNTPAAFLPLQAGDTTNRLDLARWLVDPKHPLTARVTVNRFWQRFFGTGLVRTAGDFGAQGEPPSHPDLLDWLAVEFIEGGWNVKEFLKLIVTSATYQQSSKTTPEALAIDPENRLLARGPRFRLDAEMVRDNALFVSGLMDFTIGGKGVKPYQPENIWEPVGFASSNTRNYKQDTGEALYRRSLYTFLKRTAPPPSMVLFDGPSREQSCVRRERSNTPLQALMLMNDVQHFEAARAFAGRILTKGGSGPSARLTWAFRAATGRQPSKPELEVLTDALSRQRKRYEADVEAAKKAVSYGDSKPDEKLPTAELAAYTLVANLILNLDEVVTKN